MQILALTASNSIFDVCALALTCKYLAKLSVQDSLVDMARATLPDCFIVHFCATSHSGFAMAPPWFEALFPPPHSEGPGAPAPRERLRPPGARPDPKLLRPCIEFWRVEKHGVRQLQKVWLDWHKNRKIARAVCPAWTAGMEAGQFCTYCTESRLGLLDKNWLDVSPPNGLGRLTP